MRAFLAISILSVFSLIHFHNAGVWMFYEINKTEIIQAYCVNKEKPELKCEGKCHMKEMMLEKESDVETEVNLFIPDIRLYFNLYAIEILSEENRTEYPLAREEIYNYCFLNDWEIPPKA